MPLSKMIMLAEIINDLRSSAGWDPISIEIRTKKGPSVWIDNKYIGEIDISSMIVTSSNQNISGLLKTFVSSINELPGIYETRSLTIRAAIREAISNTSKEILECLDII